MGKKKLFRLVLVLVLLVAALWGVGHLLAGRLARWGTSIVMNNLSGSSLARGITVVDASVEDVAVRGLRTAIWKGLEMTLDVEPDGLRWRPGRWSIKAERAKLRWRGVFTGDLLGTLENVAMERVSADGSPIPTGEGRPSTISDLSIQCPSVHVETHLPAVSPTSIRAAIRGYALDVRRWFAGEPGVNNMELEGTVSFKVADRRVNLRVETAETMGGVTLVTNRKGVHDAVEAFGEKLTEAEYQLAIQHPLRLPGLVEAKATSEKLATEAYGDSAKGDAYRHLLWTWLLADSFGVEFARAIAEAHEEGGDNPPRESERDRKNNELGLAYWEQGVAFNELKTKLETDPHVDIRGESNR